MLAVVVQNSRGETLFIVKNYKGYVPSTGDKLHVNTDKGQALLNVVGRVVDMSGGQIQGDESGSIYSSIVYLSITRVGSDIVVPKPVPNFGKRRG